jgi:hypothetical protein
LCINNAIEQYSREDGEDDGFKDDIKFTYAQGTAEQITKATIRSIECQHCKLRLGITGTINGRA